MSMALHAVFVLSLLTTIDAVIPRLRGKSPGDTGGSRFLEHVAGSRSSVSALKILYPYYHTTAEIQAEARRLSESCGGAATVETHSDDDVNIDLIKVRAPGSSPVNRVFILFGEHSRELISPESGLHMLKLLCGRAPAGETVHLPSLLQDNEFQFVLNGNPSSRSRVESGEYCLRTNPNGVDLNRNWDEEWQQGEESTDLAGTNGGSRPFSEPETRIFKKLVEKFLPTTFLTVHSGTRGMYMPWAFDMTHIAKQNAQGMLSVLKDLDKSHCQCPFGAAGKEVGYPCPGTCLDWVYSKLKTPYVFAFEIYTSPDSDEELKRRWDAKIASGGMQLLQSGNHLGHRHFRNIFSEFKSDFVSGSDGWSQEDRDQCFAQFNPDSESGYNSTVQNWAVAYLEMASTIAGQIKNDHSILQAMEDTAQ